MNSARPNIRRTDQDLHEAMGTKQFLRQPAEGKPFVPIMDGWGIASWITLTIGIALFWWFVWSTFGQK